MRRGASSDIRGGITFATARAEKLKMSYVLGHGRQTFPTPDLGDRLGHVFVFANTSYAKQRELTYAEAFSMLNLMALSGCCDE